MSAVRCLPALLLLAACHPPATAPPAPNPPANVEGAIAESRLATVRLTDAAVLRLAIGTAVVQRRPVVRQRTLGGTAAVPAGRSVRLVAPFAARLEPVDAASSVVAGAAVAARQPLVKLQPLLPDAVLQRTSADRDLASAQAQFDAATARHRRAEQLLADKTGSVRAVEEATAAVATATADLAAANARVAVWRQVQFADDGSLALQAPLAGVLRECYLVPGHVVSAGTLLCEVAALDPMWIHVAVHSGDAADIDAAAPARIRRLADDPSAPWLDAQVAAAPPAADAATGSIDFVYELANDAAKLRPGERVLAMLQLAAAGDRLVVPRAALLYDVHGGSWVYVQRAPATFARERVQVAWVDGVDAVLERGPMPGTAVVTHGAAELFGTEFGQGK
ncbi:MAG TPA: efflux RND transporter periplasmic adaptor subunit [Planctomycetota bacterium]|nr:efflux RND transporter periplasmic adaptor subunit [Planctomycetota bacterium]